MSGTTLVFNPAGPTVALSVVATSHAAVPLNLYAGVSACTAVSAINTGATLVALSFSVAGNAATFPVDGTPGNFTLPAAMTIPVTLTVPSPNQNLPLQVTAIGSGVGPSIVYVTPLVMQT